MRKSFHSHLWLAATAMIVGLVVSETGAQSEDVSTAAGTESRLGLPLVAEDPEAYQAVFDSLLATADLSIPEVSAAFRNAAQAYLEAKDDSLLLSDLDFCRGHSLRTRAEWHEAVKLDRRGFALRGEGDYEASAQAFRDAAGMYAALGHLRREAVAWGSLGVSIWYTGDMQGVLEAYENALAARRKLGDPVLIGKTLNGLGSVYKNLAEYDKALSYYRQALAVRKTLDRPTELGQTMAYTGIIYYRTGNLLEAERLFREALATFTPETPERFVNEARLGLANVYGDVGESRRALEVEGEILESAIRQGDRSMEATTRANMGREHLALGDFAEALGMLGKASEIQEDLGERSDLASTTNSLGAAYLGIGDLPRAMEFFERAEELALEADAPLIAVMATINKGKVYSRKEQYDRAFELYEKARTESEEMDLPVGIRNALIGMAVAHDRKQDYARALELYRQVLSMDDDAGILTNLPQDHVNVGNALAGLGRLGEARDSFRTSLTVARKTRNRDALWRAYLGIADCHEQAGTLDSARVYNERAMDAMETQRDLALSSETKAEWLRERALVYEAQVHVLAKLHDRDPGAGYAQEALAVAERGKAQAFRDILGESGLVADKDTDPALIAERDQLELALKSTRFRLRQAGADGTPEDSLKRLETELRELESSMSNVLQRIRLQNPRLAAMDPEKPSTLKAIRKTLLGGEDQAILEYALGDSASYLWVIRGRSLNLHRLPPRPVVEAEASALQRAISTPYSTEQTVVRASVRMYEMLLAPAAGEIRDAGLVYLIPDGALNFIPFTVLMSGAPELADLRGQPAFPDCSYALDEKRVLYGPSATTLVQLASRPARTRSDRTFLGVGDPVYAGWGKTEFRRIGNLSPKADSAAAPAGMVGEEWKPLPRTRDEVMKIASYFEGNKATVLLGDEARESTLDSPGFLSRFGILHFATHGLADERRPDRSELVLSYPRDSSSEDGCLQASEVYKLKLSADLVVLSACETGRGKMVRGEGVLGLPRAFLYAGASAVVVSLWSVADQAAVEMMPVFYEHMMDRGEPPAEALRLAAQHVRSMEGFSHPFYWAPFVFIGPGD